jgi:GR25 family glycosyltransferase involved in LPS biosynthesis
MKVDTLDYKMIFDDPVAHIITIKNHPVSEQLSKRCQESCKKVEQPYVIWDAFDGTNQKDIFYPDHAKDKDQYRWLKLMNDRLTIGEIATILSHFSLWCHCVTIDLPIVILEHDSIMIKKHHAHDGWNQIQYLGNITQYEEGKWPSFPPHSAATKNWKFICRAHAYSIDPAVARSLISHVIKFGISAPADMLIRADLFPIVQTDFCAFDLPGETTILGRKANWEEDAREIFNSFI